MNRVNLFLVGVNKAGTSWLHYQLDAHPDVFMAEEKELYYFGDAYPEEMEAYHAHFPFDEEYRYYGEATPMYYRSSKVCRQIHDYAPGDARVLAIVRDPIDRLRSQFYYHRQLGFVDENGSLEDVLVNGDTKILRDSHYERYLPVYTDTFGDRFRVVSLEQAGADLESAWSDLLTFLDLRSVPPPSPKSRPSNATGSASFRALYRWTVRPVKQHAPGVYRAMLRSPAASTMKRTLLSWMGTADKKPLDTELEARLVEEFRPTYRYLHERGFTHYRSPRG